MKKILAFLMVVGLCVVANSATRTWSGATNSDMNNAANYDGSGAILATDDLVFSTGAVAATASADLAVQSITTTSGYSGNWSTSTNKLTVSGAIAFAHTGTLTLGDTLIQTGDANFTIGSGVGATTVSAGVFYMRGTGNYLSAKAATYWASCSLAYAGKTTTFPATNSSTGAANLYIGAGTLTITTATLYVTGATANLYADASATINGTGVIQFSPSGATTSKISGMTMTGTASLKIFKASGANISVVDQTGAISAPTFNIASVYAGATLIYNDSGNAITATTVSSVGATNGTVQLNQAGTFTTAELRDSSWVVGSVAINRVAGCTTYVSGNISRNVKETGTALGTWKLSGTGAQSVKSFGRTYGDVVQTGSGTVTLADSLNCNSFVQLAGAFNQNRKAIRTADDFKTAGSGVDSLNSWITTTGDAVKIELKNTATVSASCSINTVGNTTVEVGPKHTVGRWVFGASKTVSFTPKDSLIISALDSSNINGAILRTTDESKSWKVTFVGHLTDSSGNGYDGVNSVGWANYYGQLKSGYSPNTKFFFVQGGQYEAALDSPGTYINAQRMKFLDSMATMITNPDAHVVIIGFCAVTNQYAPYNDNMVSADTLFKSKTDSLYAVHTSKFKYHFWHGPDSIWTDISVTDHIHPDAAGWNTWGDHLADSIAALGIADGDTVQYAGQSYMVPVAPGNSRFAYMLQNSGNHAYLSLPSVSPVSSIDAKSIYNYGTVLNASAVSNLNRGGNYGITFSTVFDTTTTDSTVDTVAISGGYRINYRDTILVDSISGTYDTTYSYIYTQRVYDSLIVVTDTQKGPYKQPTNKQRPTKSRSFKQPAYKQGDAW